jgi:hypothetical protein
MERLQVGIVTLIVMTGHVKIVLIVPACRTSTALLALAMMQTCALEIKAAASTDAARSPAYLAQAELTQTWVRQSIQLCKICGDAL